MQKMPYKSFSRAQSKHCCGYLKEPSQSDGSFEHSKQILKLMGMSIITVLLS